MDHNNNWTDKISPEIDIVYFLFNILNNMSEENFKLS